MDKEFIIAVDSGTQSIRAIVYDRSGREIAKSQQELEPYFSVKPGWAEQKPDDYWTNFCRVVKEVMKHKDVDPKKIGGLGITTQRGCIIPMDKDGTPLRNCIIWLDQRFTENPPPVDWKIKALFTVIGKAELIKLIQKNSKFTWIYTYEPEVYKKTKIFGQITTFFVKKLTDSFNDCASMYVGYWPLESKKFDWYGIDGILDVFCIRRDHLPTLFKPNEVLGHVTKKAAQETGLPEGLPVIVGAGDKQSESLGAGAITPDIGTISYGTATTMEVMTKKFIESNKLYYFTWCSALPDAWNLECFIYRGFWMAKWFIQQLGYREAVEAEKQGVAPEALLDTVIRDIPPGSMGLMLQPYWTPHPSQKFSKGSIIGFGSVHTRAHIYRSILEGIAYELRRLGELVQKDTKVPLKELRVGGGGSRSDMAVQIAADVFNLPAKRMRNFENCAMGAAIDAAVATEMFSGFDEAVESMVQTGDTFEPIPENHKIYDDLFNDVYMKTYGALAPLYRRIGDITGYREGD